MTKVVSNKKQLTRLVELMESNLDIARGICRKGIAKLRWEKFGLELNSLGPPCREWDIWLRVWTDLKFKTKKKTDNKVEINATGGGPNKLYNFSDLEEAIISMLQMDECINPPGREFGLNEISANNDEPNSQIPSGSNIVSEANDNSNVIDGANLKPTDGEQLNKNKKMTKKGELNERVLLLKNQTSTQKQFYDDISSSVRSIKRSVQNIEIYTKKTYYLKKDKKEEILKIKREKFKIYKEDIKNRDNDRRAKLKLKIELLELEKLKYNLG